MGLFEPLPSYEWENVWYVPGSGHPFHTLALCHINPSAVWVLYIHGGAWRDTTQTKSMGYPLLHKLTNCFGWQINAASIDYRLSPSPSHIPIKDDYGNEVQTVLHPEHVLDVISAIEYLAEVYDMRRYILVGHSAGATLAFQALLGRDYWEGRSNGGQSRRCGLIRRPLAVVGLEGIYDLGELVAEYPDYRSFVDDAFGTLNDSVDDAKKAWAKASPARYDWLGVVSPEHEADHWIKIVLAHSTEDELLSLRQTEAMQKCLFDSMSINDMEVAKEVEAINVVRIRGKHDEVPSTEEVIKLVGRVINGRS